MGEALKLLLIAGSYAKKAAVWSYGHIRETIEIALVVLLVLVGWAYNRKNAELQSAKAEKGQLADNLQFQVTMRDGQIEVLKRENGEIKASHQYVPPEGYTIIKQQDLTQIRKDYADAVDALAKLVNQPGPINQAELEALKKKIAELAKKLKDGSQPEVVVKDKGFCLRPGIALEYGGLGVQPRGDLKVAYFKRYSALLGGSKYGLDISASRHLDDLIWFKPQNLELWAGWKYLRMNGGQAVAGGLRVGF